MGDKPAQQAARQRAAAGRAARRPRFGAWIGTGAAAGVVVALLLALSAAPAGGYSRNQVALYLVLVLGSAGALLFGVAAAVLDARADRRDPAGAEPALQKRAEPAGGEVPERETDAETDAVAETQPEAEAVSGAEAEAERRAEQAELRAEERSAGGRPPAP